MSQKSSSNESTSHLGTITASSPIQNGVDQTAEFTVTMLLERCRGDLSVMDSLLRQIEKTSQRDDTEYAGHTGRIDSAESIHSPHSLNAMIATLGADSIRRMANDIEDLYRTGGIGDVERMLADLQSKLAHSLRLLPASEIKTPLNKAI